MSEQYFDYMFKSPVKWTHGKERVGQGSELFTFQPLSYGWMLPITRRIVERIFQEDSTMFYVIRAPS